MENLEECTRRSSSGEDGHAQRQLRRNLAPTPGSARRCGVETCFAPLVRGDDACEHDGHEPAAEGSVWGGGAYENMGPLESTPQLLGFSYNKDPPPPPQQGTPPSSGNPPKMLQSASATSLGQQVPSGPSMQISVHSFQTSSKESIDLGCLASSP